MAISDAVNDDYDPFEEFNKSAGMGIVENPYPMFALVRPTHPIKRECVDDAADRDDGTLVEQADRGNRWSFIYRKDYLLARYEGATYVVNVHSLHVHFSHHSPLSAKGF